MTSQNRSRIHMTSSNGIFSALLGGFPWQRPVMRSFYVFFDLRLYKWLSKQSRRPWFDTQWCSLWRYCNGTDAKKIGHCKPRVVMMPNLSSLHGSTVGPFMTICGAFSTHFLLLFHMAGYVSLQWRHNEHYGVSNHQPHHCLLNRLFRRISKKTSKLCVTGLCSGTSSETGEFPTQMTSYAENVSIWWRHHVCW